MVLPMVYVLPMLLGRTFNYKNNQVGIDIFPPDQLALQQVNIDPFYDSTYKMITSSEDVQNVLDISGDLVLKVKAGSMDIKGAGSYLKSKSSSDNTVEVLTKLKFYTSTIHLPFEAKPFTDWTNHRLEDLGTHYVQSITYGGELVASLKFVAHKAEDLADIQGQVSANIKGVKLESLVASGKLAKLKKDLQDKANMEITYFATVPLKGVPNTLEGLQTLVESFGDHVKSFNNGTGVPVRVELVELSTLNTDFTFLINKPFMSQLKTFNAQFDDIRKTKSKLTEWIRHLPPTLTENQQKRINDLYERITKVTRSFYKTIAKMDVEKGTDQLDESRKDYAERGSSIPGKFYREFEKLRSETDVIEIDDSDVGRSTYIRWGSESCNETTSIQIFTGYVASSSEMGVGGGTGYLCLPKDPNLGEQITRDRRSGNFLSGVTYGVIGIDGRDDIYSNGVVCSACHIGNRSIVATQAGAIKCPGGWIMEYEGYLAATKDTGHRSDYICVDKHPDHFVPSDPRNTDQNLQLVGQKDKESDNHVIFPCVVCSK